ncbi:MAG: TspO/MBR family protein, partial [Persicimonas sp.]
MLKSVLQLVASIALAQLAGLLGAVATASSVDTWYGTLDKPGFTPPDWLFGPAWITLYTLMGIAAWLVYREGWPEPAVKAALVVYGLQLLLNAAWSPAFFGLQSPALGLVVIVPLWAAIAATIYFFGRVSTPAAWLLVPYLLWVTYATALNFEIWR